MTYGFAAKQNIQNKNLARKHRAYNKLQNTTKLFILINGQDVEHPFPNQFTTPKLVKDAINPLLLK